NHSAIFQVSGPTTPSTHIVHNTGSGTPGNCWKKLGPVADPRPACGGGTGTLYNYDDDARVHRYIMHGYFIGISTSGATKSLYVVNLDKGTALPTELVEGVEDFQLTYGVDTNGDGFPERFIKANDTGMNFQQIVAVKFGMLLASIRDVKQTAPAAAKSYTIADETVSVGPDKKLRFVYNTTVKIRNKGVR
ncbi:MAG: PilW family protein, partial [Gammaproteobacteria bacterium]|nr:PilW family protein [Gammaproteobacteria bacterium]